MTDGGDVDVEASAEAREDDAELGPELVDPSAGLGPVVAHLYRGEVERTVSWRTRLDNTTNWAVTVMAAIVAYGFAGQVSHAVILAGMLVATVFLFIEARRFRDYDIWRSRVRAMQENLFANALDPSQGVEQEEWRTLLSEDYREPHARISYREAVSHRLRRIYLPLMGAMLLGWLFHLLAFSPGEPFPERASLPGVPGAVVVALVALYFVLMISLATLRTPRDEGAAGEVDHGSLDGDE